MKGVTLPTETVFVMEASPIKFGLGAMDEIAYDARRLGLKRVLIVTDRHIGELGLPDRVRALLEEEGIKADVYDGVEIEPTDRSMEEAAEYARQRELDGLIAVGGGSALDTCKAVNLLTTYPAPLLDYINQPVGRGRPVPGPLKPLIAVPTTAGTGSETTAVAVTHVLAQHVKAGVSNRLLRPALGIVDPLNTLTAPPEVTAAAGCDILTHAIESYTTRPYNARAKHHPPDRPSYIGANPASDIWCEKAIE
jgi:hydroxyacid-oxoacid transhydrogenase